MADLQYEVLDECKMMFPNTQKRLETAHADLTQLLVSSKPCLLFWINVLFFQATEADLKDAPEYKEANAVLVAVTVEDPKAQQ